MEEQILALAQAKCEQCEVYCSDTNQTVVEFRANEFHSHESRLTRGYGLRVIRGGRLGFSSTTNPDVVEEMVAAALETAAFGRPARFDLPGPAAHLEVATFDNRVIMLSAQRMTEWGRELVDAVRSRVPDIKLDVRFSRTYREIVIVNSAGLDTRFSRAEFYATATGLLVHDGLVWIQEFENLSAGLPLPVGAVADRIERRARAGRRRARIATGVYPVIVAPTAVPDLLYPLELGVNGRQREKNTSPLIGREGQQVLGSNITIADNPLRNYGLASAPFDAEGVPSRRNVLFDGGVFHGFLFDLGTAAACRSRSTGSAARDYSGPPVPATTGLELAPGPAHLDASIRDVRDGLLVHDFIGGGQSNALAGEVTLNVSSGFRIENGELTGRVKDAMIAGNVYDLLGKVEAVGNTPRDLGTYFVPFVKFQGLKIAAKG